MNNNTASKWALTQYYCSWLNPKIFVPLTQMHEDLGPETDRNWTIQP